MRSRTGLVLILVGAVLWAVGLRVAIRWHRQRGVSVPADDGRSEETKRGAELAGFMPKPAAPARKVGHADFGKLDALGVIALLHAKRTAELAEVLEAAEDEFERNRRSELEVGAVFEGLSFAGPLDLPALDAWVAASPQSFAGYVARAAARLGDLRRSKSCANGRFAQNAVTKDNLSLARGDLERAVAIRPSLVAAHTLLLQSFVDEGTAVPRHLLDRALAACPTCSGPRERYIQGLRPGSGGSRSAMQSFAEESQAWAEENPRLTALLGYADFDECTRLAGNGEYARAGVACERAISVYPAGPFLRENALTLYWRDRYQDSVEQLTEALKEDPFDVRALVERARQYTRLEGWEKAVPDLRLALELEPTNSDGIDLLGWLVERLESDARRATRYAELDEAFEAYDAAARLLPEQEEFTEARDALAKRTGRARRRSVAR